MLTPPQIICMSRLVRILIWSSMNWMWTLDVAPRALPLSGPMEPFQWRPPPDASEGIPIPKGCRSKPLGGGTSWWDVLVGNCHGFSGWSSEIPQNGDQNFVKSMYLVFENEIYIYISIYVYTFVCSVFLPPPWYGSPGSTPFPSICKLLAAFLRSSLVFARFLQHFWLPASHLLGTCYLLDNLRSTHTPSKYIHTIHTIATIRTIHTKTNHTYHTNHTCLTLVYIPHIPYLQHIPYPPYKP